jgi:hypothetical protein
MSKKITLLKQMEVFDMVTQKKLTPNQYYLLCCMRDSVTPLQLNLHLELRHLKATGWVEEVGEQKFRLAPEAVALINQIERLFKINKKKTSSQLIGKDYKEKINEYISLFPNVKLPSGKAARSAFKNVENCFRWFFDNNEYSWETIIKATEVYVNEYQSKNWKFMRTSQYFIRKQEADRTFNSDLANYCAVIESGGEVASTPTFSSKVV